jgi:hypothetical protein
MQRVDPFDPESLRLSGSAFPAAAEARPKPRRPPRHRPGEWFLRGPIPWPWLEAAARLPGKSLALALCLWREAGRLRRRTVKLCLSRAGLGLDRQVARRALRSLESAGLVTSVRKPGHGVEVTLCDRPAEKDGDGHVAIRK